MRKFLAPLGSVYFAVALLSGLLLILIVSTVLESVHGTPLVQRFFYQAGWFDVFLSLIALNMFMSMVLRIPFKRHHTGFVVTHIGALVLLSGALLSRLYGVEGQMMLFEGEAADTITQNAYEIEVHKHSGGLTRFDLADLPGRSERRLDSIAPGLSMRVIRVIENARDLRQVIEGSKTDPPNAAVQIHLESALAGFDESFWLVEKDPNDPQSRFKNLGPASFELRRTAAAPVAAVSTETPEAGSETSAAVPSITLVLDRGARITLPLDTPVTAEFPIEESGYRIRHFTYYPNARVGEGNALISDGIVPENPAVALDLVDAQGNASRELFFAFFPEFRSMHGQTEADGAPKLEAQFALPEGSAKARSAAAGPKLTIETDGREWSYHSASKSGENSGPIRAGEAITTGWMDIRLKVERLYDHARVERSIEPAPGRGFLAAELSFLQDGKEVWRGWAPEDELIRPAGVDDMIARVVTKHRKLSFSLTLKDFRKVDYPGTDSAKSYESDVALIDTHDHIELHKTIKMNEPLDYKGYRIFQSSFAQDPAQGEASIFTIAKNPGIKLIYGGAIILFTGVFMVFFIKPFSPWRNT